MEYTLFKCAKYTAERAALTNRLGRVPTADNVSTLLCGDERARLIEFELLARNVEREEETRRNLFVDMVERILKDNEEDKRRRQDEGRRASAAARRGVTRR